MAAIVLVHGSWHGGWCYRDTAKALRNRGHEVFTPTLTGLGERSYANSQAITLETHVRDVLGCIEAEELQDVVLCGHSYGGIVVTCVADRIPERIRAMVYIDALVPRNGERLLDVMSRVLPPETAALYTEPYRIAAQHEASGMTQPIPSALFNVRPELQAWVDRRCRPQAYATFLTPALLNHAESPVKNRHYVYGTGWGPSPFPGIGQELAKEAGWQVTSLPAGHDIMVDMPLELADLIDGVAASALPGVNFAAA